MKGQTRETVEAIIEQVSNSRNMRRRVAKRLRKVKMSKHGKRYITILPTVVLLELDGVTPAKNPETNEILEQTHAEFIRGRTIDPAFASDTPRDPQTVHWSMPIVEARMAIRTAVKDLEPGDVLELDEEEWQLLKRATEKGSYGLGGDSCLEFMRAITGAPMTDPRKAKKALPENSDSAEAKTASEAS